MATIQNIRQRAHELAEKWKSLSISPEEVGLLIDDLAVFVNYAMVNGAYLGIRKTYSSVSEMVADYTSPTDVRGNKIRFGQLVAISSSDTDNGQIYAFADPNWMYVTTIDVDLLAKSVIVQETGTSTIKTMSQDAVTKELEKKQDELLKRIQGTSDSSSPYYDPFKYIVFQNSTSSTGNVWDDFNTWLDELHTTTSEPDVKKAGFFRVSINGQLYEVQNFVLSWSNMEFVQVVLGCFGITAAGTIDISQDYSIIRRIYKNGSWAEWEEQNSGASSVVANTMQFSGLVRGDVEDAAWAQKVYDKLNDDQMVEFVIGNAAGEIAGGSVVLTESLGKLIYATDARVAANLGDVLRIAKFNSRPYYSIIPKHGAKAPSGYFPGTYGIMTPNDKMNLERALIPSKDAFFANMDNCLDPGVYPWCTLGRPAGSTGAFTLIVRKSTSEDPNDYFTVEQTAYGREGELGQIWKRLIFQKKDGSDTGFNDWRRIDNKAGEKDIYRCPGEFTSIVSNLSGSTVEAILGTAVDFTAALSSNKIIVDSGGLVANASFAGEIRLVFLTTDGIIVYISIPISNNIYGTVTKTIYPVPPINNLNSTSVVAPLAANQGKVLRDSILPFLWKIEDPFDVSNLSVAQLNEKFGDFVTFKSFFSVNPLPTCVFSYLGFSCKPTFVSKISDFDILTGYTVKLWFDFRSFSDFNSSWMCLTLYASEGKQWTGASVTENSSPSFT